MTDSGEMQSNSDGIVSVTERYKELLENPDGVAVRTEGDAPFAGMFDMCVPVNAGCSFPWTLLIVAPCCILVESASISRRTGPPGLIKGKFLPEMRRKPHPHLPSMLCGGSGSREP